MSSQSLCELPLLVLGSEHFGGSDAAARRALADGFARCEEGLVATQVEALRRAHAEASSCDSSPF